MEDSFRTKLQSVGDIFVNKIDTAYSTIKQNFTEATRGISITYNIQELQKEKDMLEKRIGRRLAIMRRKNPSLVENVVSDAVLKKYFYRLDILSDNIESYLNERKSRLKA
jgi:Zn-dependent M16 (insulinase) family peptidase